MKKLRLKLRNKRKNQGSGLVLVVVAVAFIGILVGSLLTAVGYAYRLKLYDYNAKDNFYYLEQAMDQVYSGVGNTTLSCMQTAYSDVVNQMVEYSGETRNYITKDPEVLNAEFKKNFMRNVADSDFLKTDDDALDKFLRSFITNADITLEPGQAKIVKYIYNDAGEEVPAGIVLDSDTVEYSTIVIKNIVLSRTAKYNRSQANGEFTQTISTDIVISQPDFAMNFNSINMNYSTLYDYTMIADNGIEITQNKSELSISGNVYAAADFYNKGYNNYSGSSVSETKLSGYSYASDSNTASKYFSSAYNKSGSAVSGTGVKVSSSDVPSVVKIGQTTYYNFENGPVSSKLDSTALRNTRLNAIGQVEEYDGVSETSMYSGLYIKGANVNMQSSELIVPGTIAVMDSGRLSLYGKSGSKVGEADVWTDNIALAGIGNQDTAPYALLRANLHVRDDLEMNANYSYFQLSGRYYGFGNSTRADLREYVPTVSGRDYVPTVKDDAANAYFYKTGESPVVQNARGHYNSSAIVINGQQSKLNLSEVDALFLAGRSYVQLSKEYVDVERSRAVETTDEEGNTTTETELYTVKSYVYDGNIDDYKTGESISIKTNQLAYVPMNIKGVTTTNVEEGINSENQVYYNVSLPDEVIDKIPFMMILGAGTKIDKVPCIKYTTSDGTVEYYYDFKTIYEQNYKAKNIDKIDSFNYPFKASPTATLSLKTSGDIYIRSAEDLAKQFIIYYYTELTNYDDTSCRDLLKDIGAKFEGFNFDEGYVKLPTQKTNVYSSGAVTAKSGTTFTIEADDNLHNSLTGVNPVSGDETEEHKMISGSAAMETTAANVLIASDDMEERYIYVKWALENYNKEVMSTVAEKNYILEVAGKGEQYITPINRYLNFNHIDSTVDLHPKLSGVSEGQQLELNSGYSVWISDQDVVVSSDREDGVVQGLVITKGNVFFDNTVSKFEGLIVSGDKIFVDNLVGTALPTGRGRSATGNRVLASISASPEVVRAILNECMMLTGDPDRGAQAKKVLSLFKSYESFAYVEGEAKTLDVSFKTIDTIQYSDVVRYNNWMKNVTVASAAGATEP